jgi:UDP-3-O-[3-hydroxymyristoyl] glucosamine N-acyltransferase
MARAWTLADIADLLGGTIQGDPAVRIEQVGTLESAGPGRISFCANPRYRKLLKTTAASAVVVGECDRGAFDGPQIIADNPYAYFARLAALLNPLQDPQALRSAAATVADTAEIDPTARIEAHVVVEAGVHIGARTRIGAGSVVGAGARIGSGCVLHPRVTIYPGVTIGDRVILHSGVVIGADGFGIAREGGVWTKIPQIGSVRIGNDVEIGANSTVDRGAIDDTLLGDGVKLDNQIQVGHNVRIGAHTAIAGCVGIAGSARIGERCTIGAAALILGHLEICDDANISAATVVSHSIRAPGTYTGVFPMDENGAWVRNAVQLRHLDELAQRLKAIEKKLESGSR